MSAERESLARYAEAWELASHALLLAAGWTPTPMRRGPWRDATADVTLPEHQALDLARRGFEHDREQRHHVKAIEALEEALVRAAGWQVSPHTGGIAWRSPSGEVATRVEAAALVRRSLSEGV